MKILVAGATGFIGQELLKKLHENGHDIVVLTRDAQLAAVRLPVLAAVIEWSLENGDLNENIFDGVPL